MASIERLERMILDRINAAKAKDAKNTFSGDWSYSTQTGLFRWSPEMYQTLGLDPGVEYRPVGGLGALCLPESADLMQALTVRCQRFLLPFDASLLVDCGGDVRAIRLTGAPAASKGGPCFGGVISRWGG